MASIALLVSALALYASAQQTKCIADKPNAQSPTPRPAPPQKIKIGDTEWTVEVVRTVPGAAEYYSLVGRTCGSRAKEMGFCATNNRIYLEAGLSLEEEQVTLLHELQHALFGSDKSDQRTTFHQFIYELSPKLLALLQQNPDPYVYLAAPRQ